MKQWGNNTKVLKTASNFHKKDIMKRICSSAKPITTRANKEFYSAHRGLRVDRSTPLRPRTCRDPAGTQCASAPTLRFTSPHVCAPKLPRTGRPRPRWKIGANSRVNTAESITKVYICSTYPIRLSAGRYGKQSGLHQPYSRRKFKGERPPSPLRGGE